MYELFATPFQDIVVRAFLILIMKFRDEENKAAKKSPGLAISGLRCISDQLSGLPAASFRSVPAMDLRRQGVGFRRTQQVSVRAFRNRFRQCPHENEKYFCGMDTHCNCCRGLVCVSRNSILGIPETRYVHSFGYALDSSV